MFSFLRRLFGIEPADTHDTTLGAGPHGHVTPAVNVDGTPMVGPVDIHGRPYGVMSWLSSSLGLAGPAVNIDGTPMVGAVDIHGHPYGVTDGHWRHEDHFGTSDHWSSNDSWSSGGSDW